MTSISNLPDDILIEIFSESVRYSSLFNPALTLGPHSAWSRTLRHKKSIVLVCKRWALLGTPFLYREIVIRRCGQLVRLRHTLTFAVGRVTLRTYIIELTVAESCYVDNENFYILLNDLRDICQPCPRLTSLNIRSLLRPMGSWDAAFLFESAPNLTKLELGWIFQREEDLQETMLMMFCDRLVSLSLVFSDAPVTASLSFPCLQEFRITQKEVRAGLFTDPEDDILTVPTTWMLPSLRSLIIRGRKESVLSFPSVVQFMERHGSTLLHLGMIYSYGDFPQPITSILRHCPNVEHLVLDFIPEIEPCATTFPNVTILELIEPRLENEPEPDDFGNVLANHLACFPSLEIVNVFYMRIDNLLITPLPFRSPGPTISVFMEAWRWLQPVPEHRIITFPGFGMDDPALYIVDLLATSESDNLESEMDFPYTPESSDSDTSYDSDGSSISLEEMGDIMCGQMGGW